MEKKLKNFLMSRGIKKEAVEFFEVNGFDATCFALMKPEDLTCYLDKIGDCISVIKFSKTLLNTKVDINDREEARLRAVERFLGKRKTEDPDQGSSKNDKEEARLGAVERFLGKRKMEDSHQGSSKLAKKAIEKKISFGWVSRSKRTFPYTSVSEKISGGVRNLLVPLNVGRDIILEKLKNHFFPNGMSKKGHVDNFDFDIVDKTHDSLECDKTLEEIIKDRAYKTVIFFLATTEKKRDTKKITVKWLNRTVKESDEYTEIQEEVLEGIETLTGAELEKEIEDKFFPEGSSVIGPKEHFTILGLYMPNSEEIIFGTDVVGNCRQKKYDVLEFRTLKFSKRRESNASDRSTLDWKNMEDEDEEEHVHDFLHVDGRENCFSSESFIPQGVSSVAACEIIETLKNKHLKKGKIVRLEIDKINAYESLFKKLKEDDLNGSFKIKFCNSSGIDTGGLKREMLTISLRQLQKNNKIFEGDENFRLLTLNEVALHAKSYFNAGRMLSISLVHGGPPPRFLHPILFHSIVTGTSNVNEVMISDISNVAVRKKLQALYESDDLNDINDKITEDDALQMLGLSYIRNLKEKNELIKAVVKRYILERTSCSLAQFMEGLSLYGILDAIKQQPDYFFDLMCNVGHKLTAKMMESLFVGHFTEQAMAKNWTIYLKKCEDGKTKVSLNDLLQFATGVDDIPPLGFSSCPQVYVHEKLIPKSSTCSNILYIPKIFDFKTFERQMEKLLEADEQEF